MSHLKYYPEQIFGETAKKGCGAKLHWFLIQNRLSWGVVSVLTLCECVGFILSLNKNLMKIRISKVGGWEWVHCLWREAVSSVWGILLLWAPKPLLCLQKQLHFSLVAFVGGLQLTERSIYYIFCTIQNAKNTNSTYTPIKFKPEKVSFCLHRNSLSAAACRGSPLNVFSPRSGKPQISKRFSFLHSSHSCILVKPAWSHSTPGAEDAPRGTKHLSTRNIRQTKNRITLSGVLMGVQRAQGIQEEIPQEVLCQVLLWLPPLLQCCITILWSTRNIRGFIISTSISPGSRYKTSLFFKFNSLEILKIALSSQGCT